MGIRQIKFNFLGKTVHVYFELNNEDESPEKIIEFFRLREKSEPIISDQMMELKLLLEKKDIELGNQYTARLDRDPAHQPPKPEKDHIHVFKKGKELFAINRDGTAHDGCHNVKIPGAIFNVLQNKFSDFKFPPSRIIEQILKYSNCNEVEIKALNSIDPDLDNILCEEIDNMDILSKQIIE